LDETSIFFDFEGNNALSVRNPRDMATYNWIEELKISIEYSN